MLSVGEFHSNQDYRRRLSLRQVYTNAVEDDINAQQCGFHNQNAGLETHWMPADGYGCCNELWFALKELFQHETSVLRTNVLYDVSNNYTTYVRRYEVLASYDV